MLNGQMVMIVIDVTEKMLETAHKKSNQMGKLKNSIEYGRGNVAGFLGELAVMEHLGAKEANTFDYDLLTEEGIRIDVKTKRTNYPPRKDYEASVANFNTDQDCDVYFFTRVLKGKGNELEFTKVYLIGFLTPDLYYECSRFMKKGDIDPSNGFTVKADCWNVPHSLLLEWNEDTVLELIEHIEINRAPV